MGPGPHPGLTGSAADLDLRRFSPPRLEHFHHRSGFPELRLVVPVLLRPISPSREF
jgi:hypothetical protein